jgi:hypothetical protein
VEIQLFFLFFGNNLPYFDITELKKCPVDFVSFLFCLLGAKILERLAKFSTQNCKSHYQFHDELAS